VAASNNTGMWNEAGESFNLTVEPAYYQTTWFLLSCAAVFLGLLWTGYRFRLRQFAWQFHLRMEERVNERTRIARDLHDTLLQSFQAVLLKLSAFSYRLTEQPETKKEMEAIVEQARQAVTEGRDAVRGLRPPPSRPTKWSRRFDRSENNSPPKCPINATATFPSFAYMWRAPRGN
jgi:hypothetical protein